MTKRVYCIFFICSMAFIFNACDTEQQVADEQLKEERAICFRGNISNTRVTNGEWDINDAIGVYALNSTVGDDAKSIDEVFDGKANIKYVTEDGSGVFTPVSSSIYYPAEGSIDFLAYYPYQSDMNDGIYKIDVSNQNTLGDIDLLFSDNAKNASYKSTETNLSFRHMLSLITLDIKAGDNIESLEELSVKIKDASTIGTFNLFNQQLDKEKSTAEIIVPKVFAKPSNKESELDDIFTSSAILIPDQNIKDLSFIFQVQGNEFVWNPKTDKVLKSGKHYKFIVTLSLTGPLVVEDSDILDWEIEEGGSDEVIVKPGDDTDTDGDGGGDGDGEEGEDIESGLLFLGSDFESEDDYLKSKKYASDRFVLSPDGGVGGSQSLYLPGKGNTPSVENFSFIAKVDEDKLDSDGGHSKISFQMKGSTNVGISIGLFHYKSTSNVFDEVFFNISRDDGIISPSNEYKLLGGFSTYDKWRTIELDISSLKPTKDGKRDAIGIKFNNTDPNTNFHFDNFTIE